MFSAPATCNDTLETDRISELPIHGVLTFHHIALIIVAFFTLVSSSISLWLMFRHATHYSRPWEQKHILRILFIIPVYGVSALLITSFYTRYVYFTIIAQVYEPLAVVSYLTLMCHLIAPSLPELEAFLWTKEARTWIFPLRAVRKPRKAMTQFNIIWFCVYQYVVVRLLGGIASLIAQGLGRYCQSSVDPRFAHIWLTIIPAISVVIAMYFLLQAHFVVSQRLKEHGVHMKLLSIKIVVFLVFWQSIVFSLATSKVKDRITPYFGQTDLEVVLQYLLLSFELVICALLHIKAYAWKPYIARDSAVYQGGSLGWRAFVDCFNLADVGRSIHRGFHWMFVGRKHRNENLGLADTMGSTQKLHEWENEE